MPSKVDVFHITLADKANPNLTLPNIILAGAETLILSAHIKELPAGTMKIKLRVQVFHIVERNWGLASAFRLKEPYTIVHEITHPVGTNPYTIEIPHPEHDKFTGTAGPFAPQLTRITPALGAIWDIYWHDDPGPYDAEITLTALDGNAVSLANAEPVTYNYGFRSLKV
jgi:hypothetical protein